MIANLWHRGDCMRADEGREVRGVGANEARDGGGRCRWADGLARLAHLWVKLAERKVPSAVGHIEAGVAVHDGARDLEYRVRRVQSHLHEVLNRLIERQLPHEELDGERRRLVRLVQVGLRRRLGWGLGVGLCHKEELV